MRKTYWYISAFFRKHGVILLSSVIGAVVIFSIFLPLVLQKITIKPKRYIGLVGFYRLDTLPRELQDKMGVGLTRLNEDGTVESGLAERWTIEDDGKTYRFLLKKGVLWQDGKELLPEDLSYSFRDVQVITNPNEIIFRLKDPYSPFLTVVSQPVFRTTQESYLFFFTRQNIIGTGIYALTSYIDREGSDSLREVVLESKKDQIIYRFYPTEADAIAGFARGEVDELPDLSNPGMLAEWPSVEITETLDQKTHVAVFFNTRDSVFQNKELRLALNYAVEKPLDDSRAVGPISPLSWVYADVAKVYEYDQKRAIELLITPASIPREPLRFVLTTTANFIADAENLKLAWETLGEQASRECARSRDVTDKSLCANLKMVVEIRINNFPDVTNFQALLVGQTVPDDPDQYPLWHTNQPSNFTGFSNTRIDSLLERGRQTYDQRRRAEIYSDFQQFFSEDPPAIFLRYLKKYSVKR